jgi:hypothetical protein
VVGWGSKGKISLLLEHCARAMAKDSTNKSKILVDLDGLLVFMVLVLNDRACMFMLVKDGANVVVVYTCSNDNCQGIFCFFAGFNS